MEHLLSLLAADLSIYMSVMRGSNLNKARTSHFPVSNSNAAYDASVKLGVGSGIGLGLKHFLARFQMKSVDGLFTSVAQKYLFARANESISRGVVYESISAKISKGICVILP